MYRLPFFRDADSYSYYHVVLRGNRREALADTAEDRRALNQIAIDTLQRFNIKLHAYCLMTHQLRALLQLDEQLLGEVLRRFTRRYSRHQQQTLKTDGELFERPFAAQRVDSSAAFLTLLRSIHLNPVIANKAVVPGDYLWSSHRAYLGFKSNALITTDYGLSLLASNPARARAAYHRFIAEGITSNAVSPNDAHTIGEGPLSPEFLASAVDTGNRFPSVGLQTIMSIGSEIEPKRLGGKRARRVSRQFLSIY